MANEEHLAILEQGVGVWNKWSARNPSLQPDLSRATLSAFGKRKNLSRINLKDTNLREARGFGANLSKAKLDHSQLSQSNFDTSNFTDASLRGVDLTQARFVFATFKNANLSSATLVGTNLHHADLEKANLESTILAGTILADVNLSGARNLDSCKHQTPSALDYQTLVQSGQLPLSFLRGCGLPDTFITFARSLVGPAIDFYSCFISYSSKNHDFAERLYADLQNKGVRCWFAPEDIKIGDKFRQRIDEAIRIHDKLLVILSEDSISSAWVEEEVESAIEREHREKRLVLFPVRIDDAVINSDQAWAASLRRMRHIGNFSKWKDHNSYSKAFERLLRDLKSESQL